MIKAMALFLAAALLLWAAVGAAENGTGDVVLDPGEKERCPVCRMYVTQYPHWIAAASMKSGKTFYFDGPKDLFRFVFDTEKYLPGEDDLEVTTLYVTDYYTLFRERADDVFFITGSDVHGPMGHELVPVKGREKADGFMKDHKGKRLLTFPEITPETITGLK